MRLRRCELSLCRSFAANRNHATSWFFFPMLREPFLTCKLSAFLAIRMVSANIFRYTRHHESCITLQQLAFIGRNKKTHVSVRCAFPFSVTSLGGCMRHRSFRMQNLRWSLCTTDTTFHQNNAPLWKWFSYQRVFHQRHFVFRSSSILSCCMLDTIRTFHIGDSPESFEGQGRGTSRSNYFQFRSCDCHRSRASETIGEVQ